MLSRFSVVTLAWLFAGRPALACDGSCWRIGGTVGAGYQKTKHEQSLDLVEFDNVEQGLVGEYESETRSIGFFQTLSGVRASYLFPVGLEVGLLHSLVSVEETKEDAELRSGTSQAVSLKETVYTVHASMSPYVSYAFQMRDTTSIAGLLFLRVSKDINRVKDDTVGAPIEDLTVTGGGRAPGVGFELQHSIDDDVSLDVGAAYLSEKFTSEEDDHLSSDQEAHYEWSGRRTTFGFYVGASWRFGGDK